MAYIEEANELMTDATGQSIATAIGNMSATSVGNLAALQTTDKTSLVGAVNEVKSGLTGLTNSISMHNIGFGDYDFDDLTAESSATWFTNWTDSTNFPAIYGSGVLLPGKDPTQKGIIYMLIGDGTARVYTNVYMNGAWGTWKQLQFAS